MPISDKEFNTAKEPNPAVLDFLLKNKGKAYSHKELVLEFHLRDKLRFFLAIIILIAKNQIEIKTIGQDTYYRAKLNSSFS